MKVQTVYGIILVIFFVVGCAEDESRNDHSSSNTKSADRISDIKKDTSLQFNPDLAASLGADQYGMKQYVIAFLKTGPNPSKDSTERMEMQKAHMKNINKMAEAGVLVLAGPFIDGGDLRGIYLFDVKTIEEAEQWTSTDPAVQAGVFKMELYKWYGSAALLKVNEWHEKVAKIKI